MEVVTTPYSEPPVSQGQPSQPSSDEHPPESQVGVMREPDDDSRRIGRLSVSNTSVSVGQESFPKGDLKLDTVDQICVFLKAQVPFQRKRLIALDKHGYKIEDLSAPSSRIASLFVTPFVAPPAMSAYDAPALTIMRQTVAVSGFDPYSPGHLKLRRGNVVTITAELDGEWLAGEACGNSGLFPLYKVVELPDLQAVAARGHPAALMELGVRLHFGYGIKQDSREAVRCFRQSSELGHVRSQQNLAWCFAKGVGVEKSEHEAVRWYRTAAEQGHAGSQFSLCRCYNEGIGVPKDETEAYKWAFKAAAQEYPNAQYYIGDSYGRGKAGLRRDHKEAVAWFKKAAAQDFRGAMSRLGWCYDTGLGVPVDKREAALWYMKAAEAGEANAQHNIGVCFEKGMGTTKNLDDAASWYCKAANQGDRDAQRALRHLFTDLKISKLL